ncbi:MAG: Bifunctional oligoribonuclease and PAP phosphatase NrnA [Planctomycetes bacterium]|nr:Bifunctional oligoribonuclease and PAP phosphatase NrnA [Planctomycetota bacterium]MCQ3949839.1 hypothetical protein [Planctomycetota bacterium]GIK53710.1 MAG: phosphoesterase RecJ-like protein [Planctomycetota bacterium]HRJ78828.1 DHH family phosphoesterase [Planctomycetota bacterium]
MQDLYHEKTVDAQVRAAAALLRQSRRVVLGAHPLMDGDAVGSMFTLVHALRAAGKEVLAVTQDGGSGKYEFLQDGIELCALEKLPPALSGYDTAVILDVGAQSRARRVLERLAPGTRVVNLDHHVDNPGFGDASVVLPDASSTGEVVYHVLKEAGLALNHAAAVALFVAVVTDTGRFNHSNSTPESFRIVASLIEDFGLQVSELTQRLYRSKSLGRIRLEAMVAETLETRLDGKIVVARVSTEMLLKTGCDAMDAAEMVTIPKSLGGGMLCLMFHEIEAQLLKCSLRSEGQMPVNEVAAKFGGGGHKRAAGLQVAGRPVAEVERAIIEACEVALVQTLGRTGGAIIC